MAGHSIDELLVEIQAMDRAALTQALLEIEYRFPMDFSREFLDKCSVDKLRHILMAACLYARRNDKGSSRESA